jgi:Tol biopolymer transport system component
VVALDGSGEQSIAVGPADMDLHSCDWSPRNDWVACVSGNSNGVTPNPSSFGNLEPSAIVIAPVTGGAFVTVIERTAYNHSPAWSSDGRQLYFVSSRDGPRDIYVADIAPDGRVKGSPQRITTGLGVLSVSFAAASQRLVYVTYATRASIGSLPIPSGLAIDTSRALALTSSNEIVEAMRVSRDGQWLLYDSTLHGNADIFRIPVAGGTPERLTNDPAEDFGPDLSPDGRAIAYYSFRSGSRDIYVKPLDGGPLQTITATPGQESFPVWSPGGDAIALVDDEIRSLFVVRRTAAGTWGAPTLLRQGSLRLRGSWLPDGRALVYARLDDVLEVIPAKPGLPRVVYAPATPSDPRPLSVVVSDDGRTLFFKSTDPEGRSAIWSVPTQGGKPRLLVRFSDPARPSIRADFAAGAGRFFFALEERQADIWVAEITHR